MGAANSARCNLVGLSWEFHTPGGEGPESVPAVRRTLRPRDEAKRVSTEENQEGMTSKGSRVSEWVLSGRLVATRLWKLEDQDFGAVLG